MTKATLLLALGLLPFAAGCDEPRPRSKRAAGPKVQTRETVGKKTQDIRRLAPELQQGGQVATRKITAQDYITLQADAYRTIVGNLAMDQVDHAIRLYEAEHGETPRTYDEFMELVIKKGKPDGIWLPMLPYYREYAYDEANRRLVVLEYPAKKAQYQRQQDEALGRD